METIRIDEIEKKTTETTEKSTKVDKQFSPFLRQCLGSSAAILAMVSLGNVTGYSSLLLKQLQNEKSEINLTLSEGSWLASISIAARMIACLLCGFAMEKIGRKTLMLIANAVFLISWMEHYFSTNFYSLLIGRFATGFCIGFLSPPSTIYVAEITHPKYRGSFTSAQSFAVSVGIMIPHALGVYVQWDWVAVICAVIPLVSFALMSTVPESPSWFVRKGQMDAAAESFMWFRGHSEESIDEFDKMVEGQKLVAQASENSESQNLLTMIRTKSFYKPFLVLVVYYATFQLAGSGVIAYYTITILGSILGNDINEYVATLLLDLTRVASTGLSCIVVRNFGRRQLTTFSGLTTSVALFGLSIFLFAAAQNAKLKLYFGIPLAFFTLYMVALNIGIHPLAWTLKGELFPLRYRSIGSTMIIFVDSTFIFTMVKTSPALFTLLGEPGMMLFFGVCCLIGTILLMMYLPETRNKTLQQIEDSYGEPVVETTDRPNVIKN